MVLLYHRVFEAEFDPLLLAVSPEKFAEHLEVVNARADIIPLIETLRPSSRPRVAITLDDGYADNLWNALPALESMNAPATLFVATGQVGVEREFWWDQLEQIVVGARLREKIDIDVAGRRIPLDLTTEQSRQEACLRVFEILKPLPLGVIADDLAAVSNMLGGPPHRFRSLNRTLTEEELRGIAASPDMEIGAHTVSHPLLRSLPSAVQRSEIRESRERLENLLGRSITSFAYPFGSHDAFSRRTVRLVEQAGFEFACSSIAGNVSVRTSPFLIPRNLVRNWGRPEFDRHLSLWLEA